MPSARTIAIAVSAALFLPLLIMLGAIKWVESQMPHQQADRVRGPHDISGIQTQGSYAWVVPSATGVILVDAGLDPDGSALTREIGGRTVHAVLLTHGHVDHTSGLVAFPSVPVYAAASDIALAKGEREPRGFMARAFATLLGPAPASTTWREIAGDEEITIDGQTFRAVPVPGHTDGSIAYLWQDVLFAGDAVLGGDPLSLAPQSLSDDPKAAEESLARLLPLDFDAIADGHVGITTAARPALFRLAGLPPREPEISVQRAPTGTNATIEGSGLFVRTPVPDVRGEQPVYLVFQDGARWRLSGEALSESEIAAHDGRYVTIRGHRVEGPGPGLPIEVLSVASAETPAPPEGIEQKVGQWVSLTGRVERFRPLAAGARFGEGRFVVEGTPEITLALSSPVDLLPADTSRVTLFGQIARNTGAKEPSLALLAAPPASP